MTTANVNDFASAIVSQMAGAAAADASSAKKSYGNREVEVYDNLKLPFFNDKGEQFHLKCGRLELDANNKYHKKIIDGYRKDPEGMAKRVAEALVHDWFDTKAPKTEGNLAF
jgi:hypothetical protein